MFFLFSFSRIPVCFALGTPLRKFFFAGLSTFSLCVFVFSHACSTDRVAWPSAAIWWSAFNSSLPMKLFSRRLRPSSFIFFKFRWPFFFRLGLSLFWASLDAYACPYGSFVGQRDPQPPACLFFSAVGLQQLLFTLAGFPGHQLTFFISNGYFLTASFIILLAVIFNS